MSLGFDGQVLILLTDPSIGIAIFFSFLIFIFLLAFIAIGLLSNTLFLSWAFLKKGKTRAIAIMVSILVFLFLLYIPFWFGGPFSQYTDPIAMLLHAPDLCKSYNCLETIAIMEDNPNICLHHPYAYGDCALKFAVIKNDSSYCSLAYSRDRCIEDLAIETTNYSYCYEIQNPQEKYFCIGWIARISHNASICEKIDIAAERDECYYSHAASRPLDPESQKSCDYINDNITRQQCKTIIIRALGLIS